MFGEEAMHGRVPSAMFTFSESCKMLVLFFCEGFSQQHRSTSLVISVIM